eukprot:Hpha_TRINITY_DN5152_c0_g1::TRINITY_DN5152_c0_g1_i1::g.192895::m.192895
MSFGEWGVERVCDWIAKTVKVDSAALHIPALRLHRIDGRRLLTLTEAGLRDELGISDSDFCRAVVSAVKGRTGGVPQDTVAVAARAVTVVNGRASGASAYVTAVGPRSPPHRERRVQDDLEQISLPVSLALRPSEPSSHTPPRPSAGAPRSPRRVLNGGQPEPAPCTFFPTSAAPAWSPSQLQAQGGATTVVLSTPHSQSEALAVVSVGRSTAHFQLPSSLPPATPPVP